MPIDDRSIERLNAAIAGRPDLMGGRTSLTVFPGTSGLLENAFINIKNRSFSVTADVEIPASGASGVILAQGGRFGGWSLWRSMGGRDLPTIGSASNATKSRQAAVSRPVAGISVSVRLLRRQAGLGRNRRISVDGAHAAEGRITRTQPFTFLADQGADVGEDPATPASEEYRVPTAFIGTINSVTIDVQPIAAADRSAVDLLAIEGLEKRAEFD